MTATRTYSKYAREAMSLLGKQIRLGRKQRRWSEHELAERAGIARATLQKIEKGDPGCAVGLVFEVAALVGVTLFEPDLPGLADRHERLDDKLALLPKAVRKSPAVVIDEF
ncbi:helix-turn-helix transcriptional regulator [Desulfurivibrio dismutans]|uniref:helix-turn-helix transcriptional regulator n=1 Tax=Desulfurivibrio dismutans TaxID=1398908 RepID=UPI0023DB85CA|nr:helix-turn-helix transcriptional regulator [Desulfurivibrio alkaliphilus]MDF1615519.1 helix-turn-helix transcriptional regulator [Desulfurivibrio alkaliphilus]